MDFSTLSFAFNRALAHTFSRKKFLLVFSILALSGLLVVFFRGLAINAGHWVKLSLTFLPIFMCTGILLSMGIMLIRIYHDEIKNKEINYLGTLTRSWDIIIGSSYFAVPIILCYLLLWIFLGIFVFLSDLPTIGGVFGVLLSFAPFLIHLGTLLLCCFSLAVLFILSPIIALRGLNRGVVFTLAVNRLETNPFATLLFGCIALVPLTFIAGLLVIAALLTGSDCIVCQTSTLQTVLKWFFIMLPFTACLTPGIIFFFNFAAEAHVAMQKK